ncbi:MAG TPA: DNA-binding response regulator [Dehalococcoidia bacterium]|nr:DNA-binding response regulator [Dehalococcoidia bacterium]
METSKIAVVEDDPTLRDVLAYNLHKEHYAVVSAADGVEAIDLIRKEKPALVILDIMLPKLDGLEVCRILRQESSVPILMLTAKTDEIDKVVGLELGADDYVTKPFSIRELMARIKAMLRRAGVTHQPKALSSEPIKNLLKTKNLEIDLGRHRVTRGESVIELSPKEFDMLSFLLQHRGQVITRDQLLEHIWHYDYAGDSRTIDVHIRWLRQKIETNPTDPKYIITVRGVGYKFAE